MKNKIIRSTIKPKQPVKKVNKQLLFSSWSGKKGK